MNQDLTIGNERGVYIRYTLPMFIGVAFQQLYNIADSVIAGKFAGEDALAAVGASYPITMLFMAVAVGCQIGCTVVISRLFGAKEYSRLKTSVSTFLLSGLGLSLFLTLFGILLSPLFMRFLNTPANIFADSDLYLKIYIAGFVFLFLYNVVTGIFNSLGDSRTPLLFLICSSLGNIVLDYVFVAGFHWGVAGVAWATFLAQTIAGMAALLVLLRRLKGIPEGETPAARFSARALSEVARIAVPSILQQSFVSVGNLFIQQLINGYGSSVIAGYSAAIKLNTFAITGFTTLGNGISGFTAQNLGARRTERIRRGWAASLQFAILAAALFFAVYFIFTGACLSLFMDAESSGYAMQTGTEFLKIVAPFYFVICVKLICDGVLRGSMQMRPFMISTFSDLILRVLLAFALSPLFGETGIWLSWPIGWIIGTALSLFFCAHGMRQLQTQGLLQEQ